jgi:hypothetical protein
MARRRQQYRQEQATSQCAWCRKPIGPEDEVFGVGARARPWVRLPESGVLALALDAEHRRVLAIVPTPDSTAKQAGNDLLFATCSQACGQALKEALQKQIDFGVAS